MTFEAMVLAAVALVALAVAVCEHRRVSSVKDWVESLDDDLGDLFSKVRQHDVRLGAHAACLDLLTGDYDVPATPRPSLELIQGDGGGEKGPSGIETPADRPARVALTVVAG